ncbi:unannotated protein [freshwater metagenome]|uniref:Unannotated protein n=1 Tax=freshwater metagenome TaxID=449393 RepID=A0A6J6SIW4_9ZZZZ
MTRTPRALGASVPPRAAALLAALLLGLTACASDSGGGDTAASEEALVDSGLVEGEVPAAADGRGLAYDVEAQDSDAGGSTSGSTGRTGVRQGQASTTLREPSVISTGTVSLRADDVAEARFEVQKVVDRLGGQVTDSETSTDEEGAVRDARLVLRVPSDDFTEAMDELEGLADLEASSTSSEDVTTQVVDTEVRIRIQRESIARIEALLARAGTIQAVVSVERELSRREADLNSLLQQQAYLADRTSLSTITVHLQRHAEDGGPDEDDGSGFLAGLEKGWDGFTAVAVGLATVTGAVLPFAAAALLVGVPGWLLLRAAARRRRTPVTAAPATAAPAGPTEG